MQHQFRDGKLRRGLWKGDAERLEIGLAKWQRRGRQGFEGNAKELCCDRRESNSVLGRTACRERHNDVVGLAVIACLQGLTALFRGTHKPEELEGLYNGQGANRLRLRKLVLNPGFLAFGRLGQRRGFHQVAVAQKGSIDVTAARSNLRLQIPDRDVAGW